MASKRQERLFYEEEWQANNLRSLQLDYEFSGQRPMRAGTWLMRTYRYADGRAHRNSCKALFYADPLSGDIRVVGGVVYLRDGDILAYIGGANPAARVGDIRAAAKATVMRRNLFEALEILKKVVPNPLVLLNQEYPHSEDIAPPRSRAV